jgi:hypothetical protein
LTHAFHSATAARAGSGSSAGGAPVSKGLPFQVTSMPSWAEARPARTMEAAIGTSERRTNESRMNERLLNERLLNERLLNERRLNEQMGKIMSVP